MKLVAYASDLNDEAVRGDLPACGKAARRPAADERDCGTVGDMV